jgi:hypothetical protein
MIFIVGYYKMIPDRLRASCFEQHASVDAQFNPNYSSLTMNISLDIARQDLYHPQLSTVAQLFLPEEAAIIGRENCENGQYRETYTVLLYL